jgi:predicted nucleic acid-binding Zn ribbon protein
VRDDGVGSARERGGYPARLGDILPGALERIGPKGLWLEARVRKAWAQAVGPDVAENAWVRRLRGTTLEIGVTSDSWGTELRYLGTVLSQKINAIVGQDVVREVLVTRPRKTGR